MTYPKIDITRPVRLTEFGRRKLTDNIPGIDGRLVLGDGLDTIYPLCIDGRTFTLYGYHQRIDKFPSIENIPEESKMIDWTKEIIDLETKEVMRVLCTDRPIASGGSIVMMNKRGHLFTTDANGFNLISRRYGNRKPDTEPPEDIFNIWSEGFLTFVNYTKEGTKERFKQSQTYKDYKNKKITVEDV